jgi:hypothetical protein
MPAGRQFHGNSASISVIFVRPATMRSSTSVKQASGLSPFSLAEAIIRQKTLPYIA